MLLHAHFIKSKLWTYHQAFSQNNVDSSQCFYKNVVDWFTWVYDHLSSIFVMMKMTQDIYLIQFWEIHVLFITRLNFEENQNQQDGSISRILGIAH